MMAGLIKINRLSCVFYRKEKAAIHAGSEIDPASKTALQALRVSTNCTVELWRSDQGQHTYPT
jgi:hypothetical protein